jgi:hypothetical protein
MAGRPKKRKALAEIDKRGGEDYLKQYLLSGGTILKLARELDLDRGYLHQLLTKHETFGRAIEAVREDAADAHAEMGNEVMRRLREERKNERNNADPGSKQAEISALDVSIAREEVAQHRFIASAWNQKRYGARANQTSVTLNLGDMHLDALRKTKLVHDTTKVIDHED